MLALIATLETAAWTATTIAFMHAIRTIITRHTATLERVLADHTATLAALADRHHQDHADWTIERQTLLNRIKPETAQPIITADAPIFPAVGFDDDNAYWETVANMTTEQLAEHAHKIEQDERRG